MQRFDARYIAVTGLLLFAISSFMNIEMSLDYSGDQFFLPNIVRAVGQALTLAPLSALSLGSVAPQDAAAASGISNMMRNLGGAIGIATLETVFTQREQYHSSVLVSSVSLLNERTRDRVTHLAHYFLAHGVSDPSAAVHKAIIAIGHAVRHQASIMGYGDTFFLLGAALVLALVATLGLRKTDRLGGGGAH